MIRLIWKRFPFQGDSGVRQRPWPRALIKLSPGCEALDRRQLLSTVPAVSLSSVPAAAVANAAARLDNL
jgi:hypothetical protein